MRRSRTQMPISGMVEHEQQHVADPEAGDEAPEHVRGWVVISCGPGWMPWIIRAPEHQGHGRRAGDCPIVSVGMKAVCAAALLALSGAMIPSIAPLPEARWIAPDALLQRVGDEGRRWSGRCPEGCRRSSRSACPARSARPRRGLPRASAASSGRRSASPSIEPPAARIEAITLGEAEQAHGERESG